MTNDSNLFKTEDGPGRLPLYEGKMVHQFSHQLRTPHYWVDEQQGRAAILGKRADTGQKLDYEFYRLGYRAIGRTTDQRALISTVLPSNTFVGNSLIISRHFNKDSRDEIIDDAQTMFVSTVMNSFLADYFIGQKISANLNMFYIYQLPIPRFTKKDAVFTLIVSRAARLICTTQDFRELWQTVMPSSEWSIDVAAIDQKERAKLRAQLDGIIAHMYGLTKEEFQYILESFPQVEQQVKDDALIAYDVFSLEPDNLELVQLIEKGESNTTEFKLTACRANNMSKKDDDRDPRKNIYGEVAAFLNSRTGGTMLIGVADDGQIIGIEEDYKVANPQKPNRDGYQLFLQNMLKSRLQGVWTQFYKISIVSVQGKDICRIDILPASDTVYTQEGDLYIRDGNGKRKLTPYETSVYMQQPRK